MGADAAGPPAALAAAAVVVCFALADLAVARTDPGRCTGLETEADAPYCTVASAARACTRGVARQAPSGATVQDGHAGQ